MVEPKVLALVRCPHCAGALAPAHDAVGCAKGHSFDVARQGYLSLLTGDARLGSADTAEMVAAREAFLAAGHFDPLAEAVGREAERMLGVPGCVVDVGAGTGWYLRRVLERMPGRLGLALDLSKYALRRAARAHPRIGAVACDAWRPLPVRDEVAALVLSVFAPRDGAELARVLGRGGKLVVITPTPAHLGRLVSALDLLTVDARKDERLGTKLESHFELDRRRSLEWPLTLRAADAANAVAMGPSARHLASEELDAKIAELAQPFDVTASVTISVYRSRP